MWSEQLVKTAWSQVRCRILPVATVVEVAVASLVWLVTDNKLEARGLSGGLLPRCTWCSPRRSRSGTVRSWSSANQEAVAGMASCGQRGRRGDSHRNWLWAKTGIFYAILLKV